jgi:hypothetical protein
MQPTTNVVERHISISVNLIISGGRKLKLTNSVRRHGQDTLTERLAWIVNEMTGYFTRSGTSGHALDHIRMNRLEFAGAKTWNLI